MSRVYGLFVVAISFATAIAAILAVKCERLEARVDKLEERVAHLGQLEADPKIPPKAEYVVALAVEDLAARLAVDQTAIRVVNVEQVNWPNSCLGYYRPGQMCAQVVTPGFRVVLEAAGKTWVYHTSFTRVIFVPPSDEKFC